MKIRSISAALLLLACAGCSAKLGGNVLLDGQPFTPASCRSGQASGFMGVDLLDAGGRKLRLETQPDGTGKAHLFLPGARVAEELGSCGPLTVTRQSSTINAIVNVMGSADLDCKTAGHTLHGSVQFENCH